MGARRVLRTDGTALAVIGVVAASRVVAGVVPGLAPRDALVPVTVIPPTVWGVVWLATAVACLLSVPVRRVRPAAVGLASFALSAWGVNWLLVLAVTRPEADPAFAYLFISSGVGNCALVALLLWGLARGKAGDMPERDEVEEGVVM